MVLGGEAFGRELGHKGGTFTNGFLALRRRVERTSKEAIRKTGRGEGLQPELSPISELPAL